MGYMRCEAGGGWQIVKYHQTWLIEHIESNYSTFKIERFWIEMPFISSSSQYTRTCCRSTIPTTFNIAYYQQINETFDKMNSINWELNIGDYYDILCFTYSALSLSHSQLHITIIITDGLSVRPNKAFHSDSFGKF